MTLIDAAIVISVGLVIGFIAARLLARRQSRGDCYSLEIERLIRRGPAE